MDPRAAKFNSRRLPPDSNQLPFRRSGNLFQSETIPPLSGQASHSRSHNLSDRVHEYYEKIIKNSQVKRTSIALPSHQLPSNLHRFEVSNEADSTAVNVSRYNEHYHHQPSISVQTAFQTSSSSGQPYTVYIEDPVGAFQRYQKKKSTPSNTSQTSQPGGFSGKNDDCSPDTNALEPTVSSISRPQCSLCRSTAHSVQMCSLKSRMPAEQDVYFSDSLRRNSPPKHLMKACDDVTPIPASCVENQGDGSEDKHASTSSFTKKRGIPSNIDVRFERDVIGQERSPISKSHPVASTARSSTSSSNGDSVPRERKKWVRPPLVGQASSSAEKPLLMNPTVFDCLDDSHEMCSLEKRKTSDECLQLSSSTGSDQTDSRNFSKTFPQPTKSSYFDTSCEGGSHNDHFSGAERDLASMAASQQVTSEGEQGLSDSCAGGRVSPSSSVTSSRRLEWDSGADVGYNQVYGSPSTDSPSSGLCTIERMALAQGCSVALQLRLDPEGTTVPATSGQGPPILPSPVIGKPTAESTPQEQSSKLPKALLRCRKDSKTTVSPITSNSRKDGTKQDGVISKSIEKEEKEGFQSPEVGVPSVVPVQRQLSNSMQDLRKCKNKKAEGQLFKSQSHPDISGNSPNSGSKTLQCPQGIFETRNLGEGTVAAHSLSSGSDATLIHVGTEEDLSVDAQENYNIAVDSPNTVNVNVGQPISGSSSGTQTMNSVVKQSCSSEKNLAPTGLQEKIKNSSKPAVADSKLEDAATVSCLQVQEAKRASNAHVCSDTDHKRGLHHHFGVLCSTVLGGHIQSSRQPNEIPEGQNIPHGPSRGHGDVYMNQRKQQRDENAPSPSPQEFEILTGESTESSAFHSDAAHEENAPCASTLTGRANSFEYLPGHMYENNSGRGARNHERPPGISTSTETDSEPVRLINRAVHHKVIDSSSHETEDDRLWASPRVGSNTLVQDLERGLCLLKGVMENKSAGRRCKRELIRRVIKKLVTSEYVEDLIEKEKTRHQVRSPFSPRKARYYERPERNMRSKRSVGPERQEISGESDEPKERAHNTRRKIHSHQMMPVSQAPRTLSTVASASKSSSLLSSHVESTSGSISLSESSDVQKESRTSVKPNPLYEPHQEGTVDWLKPATHSEKLFEMRKHCGPVADMNHGGPMVQHVQEPVLDPVVFGNDPQKQLSWVKNEINHLKILKQLLQKQETLKQNLVPNLYQSVFTTMPVTGLNQTMQMADCTSPDVPESHSPKLQPSRLQQWISLESDTSAGFGLSNNTVSSHDSQWQPGEVASGGEQDHLPHQTVSISDGDKVTDKSCSNSGRKSDSSPRSQKTRRRSVSISDTDQAFGPTPISHLPIQKKRSDCSCGKPDGRTHNTRVAQVGTYGPPSRNLSFIRDTKQVYRGGNNHSHSNRRQGLTHSDGLRNTVNNGNVSSNRLHRIDSSAQQLDHKRVSAKDATVGTCSCGSPSAQSKNSCSCGKPASISSQSSGAIKKGTASSQLILPQAGTEFSACSSSKQQFPGGGLVRVHIETDQDLDSAQDKTESVGSSIPRDRMSITDVSERERVPIMRPVSDDSLTKAVTEAVSSKVKALKNLGQIEEAEVKIRVKVGQSKVCDDDVQSIPKRVLKTQDLEEEQNSFPSKLSEMNEMIARQRAMDIETRQKLLAIAESRQQTQFGLNDVDRRIQDLLLQDYLSRHFKSTETPGTTRLNVVADAPPCHSSSVGVQIRVDKKTIGTSTGENIDGSALIDNNQMYTSGPYVQHESSKQTSPNMCVCGKVPVKQPDFHPRQETEVISRPQTAPPSCQCSCQSHRATSPRTYLASSALSSPGRQVEFELELRKQHPYKLTPYEVHETLKSRNTAYFLQFEEDSSLGLEPEKEVEKKPMEVVTLKIPKHAKPPLHSVDQPLSSQGGRKPGKSRLVQEPQTLSSGFYQGANHVNQSPSRQSDSSQDGRDFTTADPPPDPKSLLSDSDSPNNGQDLLRITPGRSHLSITVTESSADSIQSPDGESRDSPLHSARKPRKTSPSLKRKEKVHGDSKYKDSNISQTTASRGEGRKSPIAALSASNEAKSSKSKRQTADEIQSVEYGLLGDVSNTVPSLQEYLEKNHPKYLDAAEKRRRCIAEMSYLRRLRQQSRKRLLELDGENMRVKQKQQWRSRCASRPRTPMRKKSSPKATKSASSRRFMFLAENQQRLVELKKKEEKRTNRLMAEIYTRKLQEKVLKGTATIRSSVSVISNF